MGKKINSSIGGQAVLEGVMMRGSCSMATAVRDPEGKIVVESKRLKPIKEKNVLFRVPVIRGVLNFVSSMIEGVRIINRSSEVFADNGSAEPSKFEKWLAKKLNVDVMNVLIAFSVFLGLLLAVGLFVFVPQLITDAIGKLFIDKIGDIPYRICLNLIAGGVRITIFILYIVLISLMKDIKRLFMYHGAEHKTISCYEHGLDLTVENAQKMSTIHDRCGTTFIVIVMVLAIFVSCFDVFSQNVWQRILIRLAFLPIVAGISYEVLKFFAKFDNKFVRILKAPGLALQKLTTRQPDDSMVEVAIKAFTTVQAMDADASVPTTEFVTYTTVEKLVKELEYVAPTKEEGELVIMHVLGAKTRTELYDGRRVDSTQKKRILELAKQRTKGAPLQYVLGTACFYGYDFKVDQRVLIPRFDTEILAKTAIDLVKEGTTVCDLMTGSGAIGITIQKETGAKVTATDISRDALEVAKINAEANGAEVEFLFGDAFGAIKNRRFDIICCNPPYIPTADVAKLDGEVKDFEPISALDGGVDGYKYYREISGAAGDYINDFGYLILEVGIGQAEAVAEMLGADYDVTFAEDLNNPPIKRVVIARKKVITGDFLK